MLLAFVNLSGTKPTAVNGTVVYGIAQMCQTLCLLARNRVPNCLKLDGQLHLPPPNPNNTASFHAYVDSPKDYIYIYMYTDRYNNYSYSTFLSIKVMSFSGVVYRWNLGIMELHMSK